MLTLDAGERLVHDRRRSGQLSYYPAAHQLHDIERRLDGGTGISGTGTSTVTARLDELAAWQPADKLEWPSGDSWQCQDTIRDLRRKVARTHAVTGRGEPAS